MNHIYRVIFNHQTGAFQAVAETAKSVHKTSRGKYAKVFKAFLTPISLALSLAFGFAAHASPTGGQVTAGVANIAQTGTITNINQSSQNAAINWQSFNVGKNETVNFNQPNAQSVTLNRVIGNERSVIDGAMNANGKVFISNANGMLIGKDAKINVGSLVATTANISDDDLMNGRYQFTGEGAGSIENLGHISVPKGGVVALVAPIVKNGGTITAHEGNVLLASAESFSITLPDNTNFAYTLDKGTLQGLVDNGGAILADSGRVVLTAKGVETVKKSLIKHSGNIEANTVQNKNGVIELLGDLDNSALNVSGSLKAEGKESGDGGFIETSASDVKIETTAHISTKAENGKSGKWLLDPNDLIIGAGGTMTGGQVEQALQNNGDFELKSTNGTTDGKGDVIINDEISWNKGKFTINAHNDIHINATLNGTGTASLALEYGQGSKDGKYKATVDGKETTLDNDYYLDKNTPLKDRTVKINLPEGKNFSVKKGSNGNKVEFDVIHKMPEINRWQDRVLDSRFTTHNIAFGADIDVGFTKDYDGFAGWMLPGPIDNRWGHVVGLGHTVSNLSLHSKNDSQETGLFQQFDGGYIRDIGVINVNVSSAGKMSHTGGLVGRGVHISSSYVVGKVSSAGYRARVGGLVGYVPYNSHGNIFNSYAMVNVSSTGNRVHAGGLVGEGRNIFNSYATGDVSETGSEFTRVGGLAGYGSNISNSYATGNVSSMGESAYTGGLVGEAWFISNSYATGNVSSMGESASTGGLVGISRKNFSNSYANNAKLSAIGENSSLGGLVGYYAYTNGSHGLNSFFNQDKHPTLPAIGKYAHNVDKSTIVNVTGKTDSELRTPSTFKDWDFEKVWYMNKNADGTYSYPMLRAFAQTLTVTTPPTTTPPTTPAQPPQDTNASIKAPDLQKTYDGKAINTVDELKSLIGFANWERQFGSTGLKNGDTTETIFQAGTLTIDETKGDWKGAKDVKEGGYELYPTGTLKDEYQQKYIIEWNKGTLTIAPKWVSIDSDNKQVYDGTNQAKAEHIKKDTLNNQLIESDRGKIDIKGAGVLDSANAGHRKLIDKGTLKLVGDNAHNYEIETDDVEWRVLPKSIAITASRTYDGTNNALPTISGDKSVTITSDIRDQLVASDRDKLGILGLMSISLTGNAKLAQKDVGKNIAFTNKGDLKFSGLRQQEQDIMRNYALDTENSKWEITKRPLVIQAMNNIKAVKAKNPTTSEIGIMANGLVGNEIIDDIKISFSQEDANIGETYDIILSNATMKNGNLANYDVDYKGGKVLVTPQYTSYHKQFVDKNYFTDNEETLKNLEQYQSLLADFQDELLLAGFVNGENIDISQKFELVRNNQVLNSNDLKSVGLEAQLYKKIDGQGYYLAIKDNTFDFTKTFEIGGIKNFNFSDKQNATSKLVSLLSKDIKDLTLVGNYTSGSSVIYAAATNDNVNAVTFNPNPIILHPNQISKNIGKITNFRFGYADFDNVATNFSTIGDTYHIKVSTNQTIGLRGQLGTSDRDDYKISQAIFDNNIINLFSENAKHKRQYQTIIQPNVVNESRWDLVETNKFDSDRDSIEQERKLLIDEYNKARKNAKISDVEQINSVPTFGNVQHNNSFISGKFSLTRDDKTYHAGNSNKGQSIVLLHGDVIETGKTLVRIEFPDKSIVTIQPNSKVRIRFVDGEMMVDSLIVLGGSVNRTTQDTIDETKRAEAEKDRKMQADIQKALIPTAPTYVNPIEPNAKDYAKGVRDGFNKEVNKKKQESGK